MGGNVKGGGNLSILPISSSSGDLLCSKYKFGNRHFSDTKEKEEKLLKYIAGLRAEKQSQKAIESYFEAMKKFEPKDRELYDLKKWKFDDVS